MLNIKLVRPVLRRKPEDALKFSIVLLVTMLMSIHSLAESTPLENKNIIGLGSLSAEQFKINSAVYENLLPVDGVVFGDIRLQNEFFGRGHWQIEDFAPMIEALNNIDTDQYKNNFLRLDIMPGDFDWFEDDVLEQILSKAEIVATVVKRSGLKGIFFDTEQYHYSLKKAPFDYNLQKNKDKYSFEQYQDKVEEYGYRFAQVLADICPDMTILFTRSNGYVAYEIGKRYPLLKSTFNLFPAFLDGVLKVNNITVFDAYEYTYRFQTYEEFAQVRNRIIEDGSRFSRYPSVYRERINVGFGIWMSGTMGGTEFGSIDLANNWLLPEELEYTLNYALENSDGYVWLYLGGLPVFEYPTDDLLLAEYSKAIVDAKRVHDRQFEPTVHDPGALNRHPNAPRRSVPPDRLVFEVEDMNPTLLTDNTEVYIASSAVGLEAWNQHKDMVAVVGNALSTGTICFTFPTAIPDGIYKVRIRISYPDNIQSTTIRWRDGTNSGTVTSFDSRGTGWTRIELGDEEKGTCVGYKDWIWLELYGPDQPFKAANYGWKYFENVGANDYYIEICDDDPANTMGVHHFVWIDQIELIRQSE